MKYTVSFKIDTNYTKKELREVLLKLFVIPNANYIDCEQFQEYHLTIKKSAK